MKSIASILGFLVFLAVAYVAAGHHIDGIKANAAKCTAIEQALGDECKGGK